MYSNLVPFETILQQIQDDNGIDNINSMKPAILRHISRIEKDLGYGASVILKKIKFSKLNGGIVTDGKRFKVKIPADVVSLEAVGMCTQGMCPDDYIIQGNYLFFCEGFSRDEFNLIYYALLLDGNGNPVIPENHAEAITAGVTYFINRPRYYNREIGKQVYLDMEIEYENRLAEAIGDDVMPSTPEEWERIANTWKYSTMEALLYSHINRCFCNVKETEYSSNTGTVEGEQIPIYSFQFQNLTDDINQSNLIDQAYLDLNAELHLQSDLEAGKFVMYQTTGRIGFAIKTNTDNQFQITDIIGNIVNETAFNRIYDGTFEIFISKEYYTTSNVFYKFIKL